MKYKGKASGVALTRLGLNVCNAPSSRTEGRQIGHQRAGITNTIIELFSFKHSQNMKLMSKMQNTSINCDI